MIERYDFDRVPTIDDMRAQTPRYRRPWSQGFTSHHVVVRPEEPNPKHVCIDSYHGDDAYDIGTFRHGVDAWFSIMAYKFVPWAIEEIERLCASRDEWRRRAKVLRDELESVAANFAEGYPSWSDWREALTSPVLEIIDAMDEERES